jgi:competence CoiA-like predicted nuclease
MIQALDDNKNLILSSLGVKAFCPMCNQQLIPKCGKIKIHHFAHKGNHDCDPWYEPMSEWHLTWQQLARPFVEIIIEREGIKHRADIGFPSGLIIEIQNSKLSHAQKSERENFYKNMFWILNAKNWEVKKIGGPNIFNDLLFSMQPRQSWFVNSQNEFPIFLHDKDNEIIQITEIEKAKSREVFFWGKVLEKNNFVKTYINENFTDIEEIKISTKFSDYLTKKKLEDAYFEWIKQSQQETFDESWANEVRLRRMEADLKMRLYREKNNLKEKNENIASSTKGNSSEHPDDNFIEDCRLQTQWEISRGIWPNRFKKNGI